MFLSQDILSLDTAGSALQAIDSNTVSPDSVDLEASFSEVMKSPLLVDNPTFSGSAGEELPVIGSSLPLAVDPEKSANGDLAALLEDIEQIVAPVNETPSGPVVPLSSEILKPSLAELDEVKPARIAEVASNRAADSERSVGIHHLRSEADPFVRQAFAADRVVIQSTELPSVVQDNEIDLAKAQEKLATLRPAVSVPEDPASRLQNRTAPDVATAPLPLSNGIVETVDVVQKPVSAPVSAVNTAAAIQAPQNQQLGSIVPKAPAVLTTAIDVPVFDENWGNALQDRVLWMTTRNIQNAEIRLNPAELGPIRVQVSVQDDAAQLTFTAQHAQTRDALEIAMPRLREMLGENGLSLGGATVSDGDSADVEKDSQAQESAANDGDDFDQDDTVATDSTPLRRSSTSALLDTFA
ncbi:MAG: flagellar hook-length control protein FliK [Woeseiaceae bacterium]